MEKTRTIISFQQFKKYSQVAEKNLNQQEGYTAEYKIVQHMFLKEHDAQYLEVNHLSEHFLIKINFCYSLAYQVPLFLFMVYDTNSQPLSASLIYQKCMIKQQLTLLDPQNQQKGIYLTQSPINKQYFYTLHHCDLQMTIDYLIPFYFSLLGLHPPVVIN